MIVAGLLGASALVSYIVEALRSAPEPPEAPAWAPDWDAIRPESHRITALAGDPEFDSRATQTENEGVPP
jgi:hypothetical protein